MASSQQDYLMESLMQQANFSSNQETKSTNDSLFMSHELGRANDFISGLSEQEIGALNASYSTTGNAANNNNNNNNNNTNSKSVTSSEQDFGALNSASTSSSSTKSISDTTEKMDSSQEDLYSELFPLVPTEQVASSSSDTNTNDHHHHLNLLMPTPIGGSCQIVNTKNDVPLNRSLLSESISLADIFQHDQWKAADKPMAFSLDSIFPNLSSSMAAAPAANKVAEANFGSASSPLIVAAAAAASPRANALPLAFQHHHQQQQSASSLPMPIKIGSCPGSATTSLQLPSSAVAEDFDFDLDLHHRSQQSTRWKERYEELIQYKQNHGDCNVPYLWGNNRPLSEWVKRQRHQYKLKKENKHSALTDEREALLAQLGFVWNSRASLWDGRFQELVTYHQEFGNLKVSKRTAKHRALSVWLKRQRHACRLLMAGDQTTCMTEERMAKLVDLGVKIYKKT